MITHTHKLSLCSVAIFTFLGPDKF